MQFLDAIEKTLKYESVDEDNKSQQKPAEQETNEDDWCCRPSMTFDDEE
jgi:hypothetical protein